MLPIRSAKPRHAFGRGLPGASLAFLARLWRPGLLLLLAVIVIVIAVLVRTASCPGPLWPDECNAAVTRSLDHCVNF